MTPLARAIGWFRLFFSADNNARKFYELLGKEVLPEEGHCTNMGLWSEKTATLREANEALFELVCAHSPLRAGDHLVDVGCGFGGNALGRAAETSGLRVTGVNVSTVQLGLARANAAARGLDARVAFVEASANNLPFEDGAIDTLVSTEAAFHFDTRESFLKQAARVLKRGGRLVIVDLIAPAPRSIAQRLFLAAARRGLQMPAANVYGIEEYTETLCRAGFCVECVESLAPRVIPPFRRWFLSQPVRTLARYNVAMMLLTGAYFFVPWDYAVFVARRS